MIHSQRVKTGNDVVQDNARAPAELLRAPGGLRFNNIQQPVGDKYNRQQQHIGKGDMEGTGGGIDAVLGPTAADGLALAAEFVPPRTPVDELGPAPAS